MGFECEQTFLACKLHQELIVQLDLQTQSLLSQMAESGARPLYELSVEDARAALKELTLALDAPFTEVAKRKELAIPGPAGDIPIRMYWPQGSKDGETLPVLLLFHGGGFALGDLETHENMCRFYCNNGHLIVINVHYRLAPEQRFPAGVDDCYAALCWAAENAAMWGGDSGRIAVTGDSAGGNLSTVICQMARDRKGPAIAFQALVYPVVSMDPDSDYPSRHQFGGGEYFLSNSDLLWVNSIYFNEQEQHLDPRASPILTESFAGLPQTLVITAGFDPVRDEGKAYYNKLVQAGVKAEYRCFETTIHGFMSFSGLIDAGIEGLQMVADRLHNALFVGGNCMR